MGLEDDFSDIIKKARRGKGKSLPEVARQAELSEASLEGLERGSRAPTLAETQALAPVLELKERALTAIAIEHWVPAASSWPEGEPSIVTVTGSLGGYLVQGYILFDPASLETVLIDTAFNPGHMMALLEQRRLRLTGICLTHGHPDHSGGLERILALRPVPVYLGPSDRGLLPWTPPESRDDALFDGRELSAGRLRIRCLETPGHTQGGFCFKVDMEGRGICFVGDTLFAGSIGGSNPLSLYPVHRQIVRSKLLGLPPDTVLLPGHGPATTVGEELEHNPFA